MTKTKTAHTPGPWNAKVDDNGVWGIDPASGGPERITQLTDTADLSQEANARLIASAPDMALRIEKLEAFIKDLAEKPCYEMPGEFPEPGESGKAPCLSCRAKEILTGGK